MAGGWLEYLSMVFGLRQIWLVALLVYALAWFFAEWSADPTSQVRCTPSLILGFRVFRREKDRHCNARSVQLRCKIRAQRLHLGTRPIGRKCALARDPNHLAESRFRRSPQTRPPGRARVAMPVFLVRGLVELPSLSRADCGRYLMREKDRHCNARSVQPRCKIRAQRLHLGTRPIGRKCALARDPNHLAESRFRRSPQTRPPGRAHVAMPFLRAPACRGPWPAADWPT